MWGDFAAENQPPVSETPWGPAVITDFDQTYTYHAVANDWDNDHIRYQFKFDDDERAWSDYFESGEEATYDWLWVEEEGAGEVRVRAKDSYNNIGEWSDIFYVEVEAENTVS